MPPSIPKLYHEANTTLESPRSLPKEDVFQEYHRVVSSLCLLEIIITYEGFQKLASLPFTLEDEGIFLDQQVAGPCYYEMINALFFHKEGNTKERGQEMLFPFEATQNMSLN